MKRYVDDYKILPIISIIITKLQDIVKTIKMLKWNWVGHIMRTNDNKWTKRLIE